MKSFLDELQDRVLLGDGAFGTEIIARGAPRGYSIESLNLQAPELVQRLHEDYVAAGSRVIETNTFAANALSLSRFGDDVRLNEIIEAAVRIARIAAGSNVYVAGSIGPIPSCEGEPLDLASQSELLRDQIMALLNGGVDLLLFETFTDKIELASAVRLARSITDLPIIAQAAFESSALTSSGDNASAIATACIEAGADVVGANCGFGIPSITEAIRRMSELDVPLSAYINAGFPEKIDGRLMYPTTPEYLVGRAGDLVKKGVRLIGGCCGVGPDIIQMLGAAIGAETNVAWLRAKRPVAVPSLGVEVAPRLASTPGRILVELDPPTTPDISKTIDAAKALREMGVDALTIADNPLASVRVDTLTTASAIQRESGLPVVPHITGRDRNRIALQSTIMGAYVSGIRYMLCVTGDPIRMSQQPNTSGVFDVNSIGLIRLATAFNASVENEPGLSIGVALNPNVRNMNGQMDKLRRKIDAGANFALTQPIFADDRLDMLEQALTDAKIDLPVYLGILPLMSLRNAEFIHNEVPGIFIPDTLRADMAKYDTTADQRKVAAEACVKMMERASNRVHGFYIITPGNRTELVRPLLAAMKSPIK